MPAATPIPNAIDLTSDACTSSGGRSVSRWARRRTCQVLTAERAALAGPTTARVRLRRLPARSNDSWSAPTAAPVAPVTASQNPLERPPARNNRSRFFGRNALCIAIPAAIAPTSAAMVARLHRRSSTVRRPASPTRSNAADWIVSCTSVASAWFADADSPVTNAWSIVARGIKLRWNVSGAFAAANKTPVWSALPPSDRSCPLAMARP